MDNLIGKKLDGRYVIEELVGSGGMANVYRAKDLKYERTVAVKILKEEFLENDDLVRRFKNESKAIAVLDHSSIVKVFDISVTDKMQFIVMEFIDGITLHDYMDKRGEPLTYKETLFFVTQTLDALSHAHEKGVVHRDIKPQNIMLIEDGSIRVMDFGIARFSRAQNSATVTDKAIGSVHYISPEQAKGDITDAKADIYSVGVMMYEMLCGKLPFESENMVSVAIKQISDMAKPLREINPDIPEALEAITAKAMAKNPQQRYSSAKDMLGDIEEFKKNPSVKFEYKYLSENTPERYIDKIVKRQKNSELPMADKQKVKKKHHYGLPILAGMATAFAIGAVILVFMIFKLSGNPLFNEKIDVDLPNFTGMSYDSIKSNAEYKSNFKFVVQEKYNDSDAGVVYDQYPKTGKKVKQGAKITLRVSLGVEMVAVPDVVGKSKDDAQKKLKESNFYISYRSEVTTEIPPGKVTRIEPEAGTSVKAGSTIYVYVSQEKIATETKVPLIQGVLLDEAKVLLSKAVLSVGTITTEESDLPAGTVIEQSPTVDTQVKKGTTVNVKVAKPIEPRTRNITVTFDAKVNAATWNIVCDGITLDPYKTLNGTEATWNVSFTNTGIKSVVLTNSLGDSYSVSVDFSPSGGDASIAVTGTYVPVTRTVTVSFNTSINSSSWTATLDGATVSTFTTEDGKESTWIFNVTGSGQKTVTISGNNVAHNINVNFEEGGTNPSLSVTGTYTGGGGTGGAGSGTTGGAGSAPLTP